MTIACLRITNTLTEIVTSETVTCLSHKFWYFADAQWIKSSKLVHFTEY